MGGLAWAFSVIECAALSNLVVGARFRALIMHQDVNFWIDVSSRFEA